MFNRRARWIDQFTATMSSFGLESDVDTISELAEVVYEIHPRLDPAAVARSEFDKWPHAQCAAEASVDLPGEAAPGEWEWPARVDDLTSEPSFRSRY